METMEGRLALPMWRMRRSWVASHGIECIGDVGEPGAQSVGVVLRHQGAQPTARRLASAGGGMTIASVSVSVTKTMPAWFW